ncbi:SDR family NAD(P)-dependent oxidoreductase [Kutzneria viridogrisea]|uniref:2-hydroxycyclohexanecarboxyl-CoA dehydrogenase n=2 Tax=Kutzneria TaxID=43356 RepID=W5W757_9PSEU|nr:SDR family oxidoreductase [Kutzneria albida]AHH96722.1 2-hydroxycyclohexanecarboxyl-CoA dehydrogenase [Kutzneria albida DSM 43870]MBA8928058.1 NADP-dependent 3-hydroxy acid dehydrogenase YdfG [Kutzneria viridogrisea]
MTSYENLTDRTALITGAASGMGEAIARLLGASGARVALLSRRADRLTTLADKIIADGGRALAVPADLTDSASVDAAAARVRAEFGPVDLVVNNAGVMLPNPITDGREDQWQRMIDTNLVGALRVIRTFVPDLVESARAGRTADLVDISSIGAHMVFPNYAVYSATKAALTHLSASLRSELGPQDVRVTNIEPGATQTELTDHLDSAEMVAQLDALFTTTGLLSAEEIADVVGYVTSRPRHVNLRQIVVLPTRQA